MASKKLTSSGGYFNKEMLAILNKGGAKKSKGTKKSAQKKNKK